jgi:hypothetical protein
MSKNDGGPAFGNPGTYEHTRGMSLRDWFAGQALSAFHDIPINEAASQFRAAVAYQLADAMLAERSKP